MSSYINIPQPLQVEFLADDLLNFLSNTKIKDLNNPYAGIGGELWLNGTIKDADNSLLQQIGEFYALNNLNIAEKFVENVSKAVMLPQYEYEVLIDNKTIYPKDPTIEHNQSKNTTDILLTSKKITFGIVNKTTSDIWGPYQAEVFAWQR
ncbi:hypothetical protein HYW99_00140 [Candidatus Woesearchaeota archaeon]|nr:hypothetical protein [Candidatus Woesearchaeota archaeon]